MKKPLVLISLLLTTFSHFAAEAAPAKVQMKKTDGKYRLYVDGREFYVKGAGCEFGSIEKLGLHGANSFRTWRSENGRQSGQQILDRARKSGLMALMGLELTPERQGFDYSNAQAVARQFENIKAQVLKYKDDPALLGWLIGNELNLFYKNPKVWDAVNDIAKFIHQVDPNHPATTALAGISKDVVEEIKKRAPGLDFLSVQFYGDIINLQKRLQEAQYDGPYMVSEWGATGHWEVPLTPWKAPIEETSSRKAQVFAERYEKAIAADPARCLGSCVFLWGQKQERTPTWYGMFTEGDEAMETVEAMHTIWTGRPPSNRCPRIESASLNGNNAGQGTHVPSGSTLAAALMANDPDGDPIEYIFEIMPESTDLKTGGDFEAKPPVLTSIKGQKNAIDLKAPVKEGAYRLFFYARDGKGNCGTANIPFYVDK